MPNRPKIYFLLALFYLGHGTISILSTAIYRELPYTWISEMFKLTFKSPYIIYYWLLPIITITSIFKMRKYSFYVFLMTQITMFLFPFISKNLLISEISFQSQTILYVIQTCIIAGVIYFTRKDNYQIFLEASKRQWEWAKRYPFALNFSIKSHSTEFVIDAQTKNISSTGILFCVQNFQDVIKPGQKFLANISFADIEISLPFKVVRSSQSSDKVYFGARFNHRGLWQYVQLRRLIHEVSANRFHQSKMKNSYKTDIKEAA